MMFNRVFGSLIAVGIFLSDLPVAAQEDGGIVGMVSTDAQKIVRDGQFTGCALNVLAIAPDAPSSRDRYITLIGQVALTGGGGENGLLEVSGSLVGIPTSSSDPPAMVDIETLGGTSTAVLQQVAETTSKAGGMKRTFKLSEPAAELLRNVVADQAATFVLMNSKGGAEVRVPLDLQVVGVASHRQRQRSTKALQEFRSCLADLSPPFSIEK